MKQGVLVWTLLILLGLIWGGSFLAVALALDSFGPITIAAIRISLAAVVVTGISFAIGHGLPETATLVGRKIWIHSFGMALFSNAIPFALLSWGQQHVTSGYAGITMAVVPLLVLPLSHFLVPDHRMTRLKTLGFTVGFIGVVILIGPAQILASEGGDVENIARIVCILASCCYAIGSIITRLSPQGPLLAFSSAALILGALVITPIALLFEGIPQAPSAPALWAVIYLGVFPTALATAMLVYIVKTAGPPFLSLVNYQVPIWAVIFGTVLLSEALPGQFIWALGLILLGLAVSQSNVWQRR